MTPTAARITGLLPDPETREAYDIHRHAQPFPDGPCLRCGSPVTAFGTGQRRGLCVAVRDRGTDWRNREVLHIHRGCIPKAGETPQRIRARALHGSQVRT